MVSGRDTDYLPRVDYLGKLNQRLAGYVHVQSIQPGDCKKLGAASADIYVRDGKVVVEHATRCLHIETNDPKSVVNRIKEVWRHDLRGPCLRDRSVQAQAAS